MALTGDDTSKFRQLCSKVYKDQAIWFLNAYWHKFSNDAEKIWNFTHKCYDLDLQNRKDGSGLDEMNAHRLLESFQETMTVREMRDALRSAGAIEKFSTVPLTHFLVCLWKVDWKELVNASQGDNKEEIEKAQRMLVEVQNALNESEEKVKQAAEALRIAKSNEASSKAREAEAEAAKAELEAALAELKAQEDAFNNKSTDLKRKSEEGSVVQQNKAKNELAQHLASDPLPLRKAKITQEAAVKKADRATKVAADARVKAEESRRLSSEAKDAAERAVDEARAKVEKAEEFLQEVKSKPGNAAGAIWWMERELHEAKKYIPERKGGIKKA